jgi:L-arabinose isomerase
MEEYMSIRKPVIGLLPLYLELYDRSSPEMRPGIEGFYKNVADKLQNAALEVITFPVCRLAKEFADALDFFEKSQTDAVVTLHLAYSPSLESEEALRKTKLPIIILDTTPDFTFDQTTSIDAISYNHGIHGVQDMCNLLIRNKKTFKICAGHMDNSNAIERVVKAAQAAVMVKTLKNSRVGLVGDPFRGMGDFSIPFAEMKKDLGITVVP